MKPLFTDFQKTIFLTVPKTCPYFFYESNHIFLYLQHYQRCYRKCTDRYEIVHQYESKEGHFSKKEDKSRFGEGIADNSDENSVLSGSGVETVFGQ